MLQANAALALPRCAATEPCYRTELLRNTERAHLDRAAELIVQGEIVAFGFNGIFAFVGDADQTVAAQRMADAKGQSRDKPLALLCAPECLHEFVNTRYPAIPAQRFEKILGLQRALHGLGVILPAAADQLPPHA